MAVEQRDPHSGYMLTGHEWHGITELNTPVPRIVYLALLITGIFSVIYWLLMPAWPTGTSFTKGLLGNDQRSIVSEELKQAALERNGWSARIEAADYKAVLADPQLMAVVRPTGRRLFGDNCAVCHGSRAQGGQGFPPLTTSAWLWGGDPEAIAETIRIGINSTHPDTRVSQMPAFGRDQMLPRAEIEAVVAYVRGDGNQAGKALFAANCASCHGDGGKGNPEVGAPDLTDGIWTYGGDLQSVFTSVWRGRQGYMPSWDDRLSPLERKILALYLIDRRGAP